MFQKTRRYSSFRFATKFLLESLENRDLPSFITAHSISLGFSPQSRAVGDFNSDGIPDIALGGDGSVTILKGKGDATFKPTSAFGVGTGGVGFLRAVDLNGDGELDLAMLNSSGLGVVMGVGNGTFLPPVYFPVVNYAIAIIAGDFNGDGYTDVVTASHWGNKVSVFRNNGDGSLANAVSYATYDDPYDVVAGDFDGDGDLDLAVSGSYYDPNLWFYGSFVEILRNQGNGTFVSGAVYKDNKYARGDIVTGDFDQDGDLDLATGSGYMYPVGGAYVSVRLGNGDGTFASAQRYAADTDGSIGAGDLDDDGVFDIVSSNYGNATVSVLKGLGNGGFQQAPGYAVGGSAHHLALADLDGDGDLDMTVLNGNDLIYKPGAVTVLRNKGNGLFVAATIFPAAAGTWSIATADFNRDGSPDLALASQNGGSYGSAIILMGNGDGRFRAPFVYSVGKVPKEIIAADLNGDGWPDLAVTNNYNANVSILINKADGTFFPALNMTAGSGPSWLVAADFTNDGKPDLLVANNTNYYSFLRGTGTGRFRAPVSFQVNGVAGDLAADDVDGDGNVDFVAAVGGTVSVFRGNGHGAFQLTNSYTIITLYNLGKLLGADFNNDGIMDIAVLGDGGKVNVLLGNGNGTFQPKQAFETSVYAPAGLTAADINRDGKLDLAASGLGPGLAVLLGNGDGTFQTSLISPNASGGGAFSVTAGDFNGDGWPDLAASQYYGLGAVVAINAADGSGPQPGVNLAVTPDALPLAPPPGPIGFTLYFGDATLREQSAHPLPKGRGSEELLPLTQPASKSASPTTSFFPSHVENELTRADESDIAVLDMTFLESTQPLSA